MKDAQKTSASSEGQLRYLLWIAWTIPVTIALIGGYYIYRIERSETLTAGEHTTVVPQESLNTSDSVSSRLNSLSETQRVNPIEDTEESEVAAMLGLQPSLQSHEADRENSETHEVEYTAGEGTGAPPISGQSWLYWIGEGNANKVYVVRAKTDLSIVEELFPVQSNAGPLAIDPVNNKVFWTTRQPGKLYQSDLRGNNIKEVISDGLHGEQYGICVVPGENSLFICGHTFVSLVDTNKWTVKKIDSPLYPSGLSSNPLRRRISWCHSDQVFECSYGGENVETLPGSFSNVNSAIIPEGDKRLFWIDYKSNALMSRDFDSGSTVQLKQLPETKGGKSLVYSPHDKALFWGSESTVARVSLFSSTADRSINRGAKGGLVVVREETRSLAIAPSTNGASEERQNSPSSASNHTSAPSPPRTGDEKFSNAGEFPTVVLTLESGEVMSGQLRGIVDGDVIIKTDGEVKRVQWTSLSKESKDISYRLSQSIRAQERIRQIREAEIALETEEAKRRELWEESNSKVLPEHVQTANLEIRLEFARAVGANLALEPHEKAQYLRIATAVNLIVRNYALLGLVGKENLEDPYSSAAIILDNNTMYEQAEFCLRNGMLGTQTILVNGVEPMSFDEVWKRIMLKIAKSRIE